MASPTLDRDAAAKMRIISHMNHDHQRSLSLYLRHYSHLSAHAARTPQLLDITFSSLAIQSADGKTHTIPMSPPLATWADARPRVVAMDKESRRGLGVSEIDLSGEKYIPPTSIVHATVFAAVVWFYLSLVMQALGYFAIGGWWYTNVLRFWPIGGAEMYLWIQKMIWIPVLALHLAEATWLAIKLKRFGLDGYGKKGDMKTWWLWVSSTFVEGYGAHERLGSLIRRREREAEKRAH